MRRTVPLLAFLCAIVPVSISCSESADPPAEPVRRAYLLSDLQILPSSSGEGTSEGVDVDHIVSEGLAFEGCGNQDFTNAAGEPGIDNSMGLLWAILLRLPEGTTPDLLIRRAVSSGELPMVLEMEAVEEEGGAIRTRVYAATGDLLVGADGIVLPNQTVDASEEVLRAGWGDGLWASDGSIDASGMALTLPVVILNFTGALRLELGRVVAEADESGTIHGHMGGAITLEELDRFVGDLGQIGGSPTADSLTQVIPSLAPSIADLMPAEDTGICGAISAQVRFSAVPVFVRESSFESDAGT